MELLLPTAAKKLDLSFNIESNVPACQSLSSIESQSFSLFLGVFADYARIRQGMNLTVDWKIH